MKNDPDELTNLIYNKKFSSKRRRLKKKLKTYVKKHSRENLLTAPEFDQKTKEKLKSLGYLN